MMSKDLQAAANFLFEVGQLSRTPRATLLGCVEQSVAEHINRATYIAFILGKMEEAKTERAVMLTMFHDVSETRTGDLNYVNKKYLERGEAKAVDDMVKDLSASSSIRELFEEYEARETIESKIAKDADILELAITLKEQSDQGHTHALTWLPYNMEKLSTVSARQLAKVILTTDMDAWWRDDAERTQTLESVLKKLDEEVKE
jgi:putative hydrolase of HD superfamily